MFKICQVLLVFNPKNVKCEIRHFFVEKKNKLVSNNFKMSILARNGKKSAADCNFVSSGGSATLSSEIRVDTFNSKNLQNKYKIVKY